jgi:hypothetical protein
MFLTVLLISSSVASQGTTSVTAETNDIIFSFLGNDQNLLSASPSIAQRILLSTCKWELEIEQERHGEASAALRVLYDDRNSLLVELELLKRNALQQKLENEDLISELSVEKARHSEASEALKVVYDERSDLIAENKALKFELSVEKARFA